MNSFNPHSSPMRYVPFHRWINWGTDRWCHAQGHTGNRWWSWLQIQAVWILGLSSSPRCYPDFLFLFLVTALLISNVAHALKQIETRNQWQEENWKIHKYVEIKRHTLKHSMGQRRNLKGNEKISWEQMKTKTQHTKTYGIQRKQ